MKSICMSIVALAFLASPAAAADPTGEWMVEDGVAHIRIENCSGQLWGIVSWEKEAGGIDSNNPDAAKRARPTMGMPVLLGMKPAQANRWDGQIYNSENGKTYTGNISLASADVLRVEGCVLGFLCGGQNWTRVKPESRMGTVGAAPAPRSAPTATNPQPTRPRAAPASPTNQEICANITRRMSSATSTDRGSR